MVLKGDIAAYVKALADVLYCMVLVAERFFFERLLQLSPVECMARPN